MNSRLVKGLTEDQVKELRARYANADTLLATIRGVVDKELKSRYNRHVREEVYSSPNALAVLADNAGYIRGMEFVLSLLTPKDTND